MNAETVEECIWRNAQTAGWKTAVKGGGKSVSYGQLRARIAAAAALCRSLPGYAPGRAVLLSAGNRIEFAYAYFGAHLAGLRVAPLGEDVGPGRFSHVVSALRPFAAVGLRETAAGVASLPLADFAALEDADWTSVSMPAPDEIADVLFTTGTTGAPKGVPLTYANEYAAVCQINAFIGNRPDDVELLALPVGHSFGLGRLRCCLANAQTVVLMGGFANVKKLFRTMEEEHAAGFTMVPAGWRYLQKMCGDGLARFAGRLKYIEMGSAPFSESEKRHLARLFPDTRVTMHYGLTEASRSAFMEFHEDDSALGSVGRATPGVEIGIFDESGNRLPPGVEGEICVKGRHVTRGYLDADNSASFHGGFFRTGDCGVMDASGYIYLKSRIKEIVNVGGKKVAPVEVDEAIMGVPGVEDCACVGVPDPEGVLGEVVKACVVKAAGSDVTFADIGDAIAGKLEGYKRPAVWQWIDAVPRTHNGKILRGLLK